MRRTYIKPQAVSVALQNFCSGNELVQASVQTKDGKHVDSFPVVNENDSKNLYDWDDVDDYGGDWFLKVKR